MTGLKALTAIFFVTLAAEGSTCHGQSSPGPGESAKDSTSGSGGDVSLQGVDTSSLTPRERKEWSTYVSELLAPCSDVPVPIAQCVQEKRSCSRCLPAAKYVLKGVRDGLPREQIEKSYHNRFDADRIKNVPIEDSPGRGPTSAPVTLVEFADFECPFCAQYAPVLEKSWNEHKTTVRMVFKFFPLAGHPHGEIAARAGVAAMNQGKFWEMNQKMFANRDHLEQSDLDSYAKEIGLNMTKFRVDTQAQETTDRIAKDRKLGESLDLKGTPTIFINGREFDLHQDLNEWINLELTQAGIDPKAAAASPAPNNPWGSVETLQERREAPKTAPAVDGGTASPKK